MQTNDDALLEAAGWTAECLSPLELRHAPTGSFASGQAALYVLACLREEACETADGTSPDIDRAPAQLAERVQTLLRWIQAASEHPSEARWKQTFDIVYSPFMSGTLRRLSAELGVSLDFHDPNGSYEDDVRAYANAWEAKAAELKDFFSEFDFGG